MGFDLLRLLSSTAVVAAGKTKKPKKMNIIPTNLGSVEGSKVEIHVEAIVNGKQVGIAYWSHGALVQCIDRKWSTQQPKPGMSALDAAKACAQLLLSKGGVAFA